MYLRPFEVQGSTVNAAVTATSTVLQINAAPVGNRSVRIANVGSQVVFIAFGTVATTVSAANGCPLQPNSVETFLVRNENTHVAHIAAATGSTIYVTLGEGA